MSRRLSFFTTNPLLQFLHSCQLHYYPPYFLTELFWCYFFFPWLYAYFLKAWTIILYKSFWIYTFLLILTVNTEILASNSQVPNLSTWSLSLIPFCFVILAHRIGTICNKYLMKYNERYSVGFMVWFYERLNGGNGKVRELYMPPYFCLIPEINYLPRRVAIRILRRLI